MHRWPRTNSSARKAANSYSVLDIAYLKSKNCELLELIRFSCGISTLLQITDTVRC